jgi:iron complex outermembrane receptor protein
MSKSVRYSRLYKAAALSAVSALAMTAGTALAQAPDAKQAAYAPEEIIVTARKRDESIMKAPVVMSAISAQQIQNLKINNFQDMAQVTPGLQIAPAFGTVGMYVYFRGLGNGGGANFADQAVQLNIDGIGTTHGAFYRAGMFDVGQIEVLKGPQALFFGRSSSAGIIAIHSADPTPEWQTKLTAGYEFDADEMDLDAYISGPITDKLGIRLAGYHNTYKGWLQNADPIAGRRIPNGTDDGGRVTLKYDDPDAGLRVNLKFTKARSSHDMWSGDVGQRVCFGPTQIDAGWAYDDCKLSRVTQSAPYGVPYNPNVDWYGGSFGNAAAFATGSSDPLFKDGKGYTYTDTEQVALNVDYDIADGLTVTSVTGYSFLDTVDAGPSFTAIAPGFFPLFYLAGQYRQMDYSQELRLTSNWKDSWINFMLGGFYNANSAKNGTSVNFPAFTSAYHTDTKIATDVYSAFGQVILTPIEHFELAGGLRFTKVKKDLTRLIYQNNTAAFGNPANYGNVIASLPSNIVKKTENNTSPEITLTWRPTDELTAFVSWKKGYKAPGINVNQFTGSYVPGEVGYFNGEKVNGFEGGVKASLLDQHLNLTASAYTYGYKDLQVVFSLGSSYTTTVANGADARIKGFELGATYNPPGIEGLNLSAALNYNDSKFTRFSNAPCYGGQQFATGGIACTDINPDPAVFFGTQDLTGTRLAHAPQWTGQLSVDYRTEITEEYSGSINLNANFSSSYDSVDQLNPTGKQKGYVTLDTALRFGKLEGPWELGLIVRNITNKYYIAVGYDDGASFGTPGDTLAYMNRPRHVMIQLTERPDIY